MPTWLVHGFRWPRPQIRIHVIIQNLDDAAPEWLMAPATTACLTENFKKIYADQMAHLPNLRFIEQYDPEDLTDKGQPYAYVCDQVQEVKLGVDIEDIRGGVADNQWAAIAELRDKVAPGEKLGWFVVVNGDVERWAPPLTDDEEDYDEEVGYEANENQLSPVTERNNSVSRRGSEPEPEQDQDAQPKGFKKWFGKVRRARSSKDLTIRSGPGSPTLPKIPPSVATHTPKNADFRGPVQGQEFHHRNTAPPVRY